MFGQLNRIKIIKELLLQKLDDTLSKLAPIQQGINHLLENESVIFTSLIHLTNLSKDILNKISYELPQNEQLIKQIEIRLKEFFIVSLRDNYIQQSEAREKGVSNILTQLEENGSNILTKLAENDAILINLTSEDKTDLVPEPDVLLMGFLYSFLPHRVALDIGANIGNVSEILLESGYQVYAFEPYTPTFAKLTSRLNNHPDFHPMDFAIGADDGEIDLYIAADTSGQELYQEPSLYNTLSPHSMPSGLEFMDKVPVTVRSLKSLQADGKIPEEIGLLKIDSEGYDLEVIRGCSDYPIPVIVTEFWDKNHVFANFDAFNSLKVLVQEMRVRKYYWYIVVARRENQHSSDFVYEVFYYCNFPQTLNNSWGNVFFFNEYQVFKKALDWCATMLPMAYFK